MAAVEFAIIAPVLITLLAGAANIGFAADHGIRLANAARAGAQYATVLPGDAAGAQSAAQAILPGASVTVAPMVCTCPLSGATGGPTVGCNTACATGMARYITVTVSMPPPQIPGLAFATALAANRSVVARVQ
ncbi:TadE/TadG family type IV pilus assembly protein [Falsiroseomonas sp. E2-1-a4]|uniref:TadE/TadG family type IV pilus assembly protein n=1 Tax=Falsiroseomonas sp. E2-1-a4 TaxID=3239299 RepID=UPI003F598111